MKKLLLLVLITASYSAIAQESVSDYFFKNADNLFTFLPESESPQEETISLGYWGYEPVITKKMEYWGRFGKIITRVYYGYTIEGETIVSNAQYYDLITGKVKQNDQLTLLTLPAEKSNWVEYLDELRFNCKSEWVYVSYVTKSGKKHVDKAIKITKSRYNKLMKKTFTNYSYWTKGDGYIAKYNTDNISKKITIEEQRKFLSTTQLIKEVTEKEYKDYLKLKAQEEEAKRQAAIEEKYQKFLRDLKPQKLNVANFNAATTLTNLFYSLEEKRMVDKVMNGEKSLTIASEFYIDLPPESEWYLEAPEEDRDTLEHMVLELMRRGVFKGAVVVEPASKREVLVEEYWQISANFCIESYSFDVVKRKNEWVMADKKLTMPEQYSEYIAKAAQSVYDINKKAKKQNIELRILFWNDRLQKVWFVQKDFGSPSGYKYTCLKDDWSLGKRTYVKDN